ncbi:histamine H2 receptor-like isoform X1 [Limulus polyphemus]|uniref:Histamine H2 receptor-like isoform X1 n=2 Tax=Limulus polyphemus TaxID=6850 RepID=A0ABM1T7Z4_LIMPO|nr:histamine H2 receptor-like isoform X1 [Limulus polyphemus]XP_022252001.1 histamine H2 receptor-like isoform X1 [Limulus polyphemus]
MNVVRFGPSNPSNVTSTNHIGSCHPAQTTEATALFIIAMLGVGANVFLMMLIVLKRPLRRWSQGLLFHQGLVDCARASLLVPLAVSVMMCQSLSKCSILETAFLLLVTVSTVNLLTSVINDAPLVLDPDQPPLETRQTNAESTEFPLDSRQCIAFGFFIIWFASITINLGPTFLSGALSGARETGQGELCPMVYGPVRHYVLNVLWVSVNMLCVLLTAVHLRKLHRDLTKSNLEAIRVASLVTTMISVRSERETGEHEHIHNYIHRLEREGLNRVKMFVVLLVAYVIFWGPLFAITLAQPGLDTASLTYQVSLHVAFVHAFVNPTLLLMLNRDLRQAASDLLCCRCCLSYEVSVPPYQATHSFRLNHGYMETTL